MKMQDLLSIEQIIPSLRAANKRDALRKLAAQAAHSAPVPATVVVRSVLEGAELPAFGPGTGVSLPHAFVPELGRPLVTFARLQPAVDFGAADGSKTDLVALLLSPPDNAGGHLRALACLARTMRDAGVRRLLRGADSCDSVYAILCGYDESHSPLRDPAFAPSERALLRQTAAD